MSVVSSFVFTSSRWLSVTVIEIRCYDLGQWHVKGLSRMWNCPKNELNAAASLSVFSSFFDISFNEKSPLNEFNCMELLQFWNFINFCCRDVWGIDTPTAICIEQILIIIRPMGKGG